MEYAFLIYMDEKAEGTPTQVGQMSAAHAAYSQMLVDHGVLRGGSRLNTTDTATLVRLGSDGSERLVTDGPYAETKEQLGGFYLVDCSDLDKALEYARQLPLGPGASVEVRPTIEMTG
ncbi:MAG: YciI family protein [Mycobacteriales bacterium]